MKIATITVALSLAATTATTAAAESPEQKGLAIAVKTDKAGEGYGSEVSKLEMKLINAHGDVTSRKMFSQILEGSDDGDKSIFTFEWPADVKGTRMLTWTHKKGDDDQWLYLPAIKRVKRISSRNKTGSFMGSEFSYEDLAGQEVEKFTYKYVAEPKENGRPTWQLERYPVDKRSGYTKQVVWIDKEYQAAVKIDYYDRKGVLLKTAKFEKYKKHGKYWRPNLIDMTNVQTKKRSVLSWNDRKLGQDLDEDDFDHESLED